MRYDVIIVGSGPAGLSAAVNAQIRKKSFLLFGSKNISEKLEKAHTIQNYLGFYGKTGAEIKEAFETHIHEMGIDITEEKVTAVYPMGDYFAVLANNKPYECRSVILASGVVMGKKLPGEENLLGRGVSYCATCDGALYKEKPVAVIGYSKKEEEEVDFLAQIASKVFYIPMYRDEVSVSDKVEVIRDNPIEIIGKERVTGVKLKEQTIDVDGVFILRESISPDSLLPGIEMDGPHIKVDRLMQSSIPGCFAAGDIIGKPYQYIKAAGEGNIAALSAASYLDQMDRSK